MPKLSVWMIRSSLLYMAIGFLFGALILLHKGMPLDATLWRFLNPHAELMIFGWTMQFVMGTAFWILPRFPNRERRYGNVRLGWMSFIGLNIGLLLTAFGLWFGLNVLTLVGRFVVLISIVFFLKLIWTRVKPFGIHNSKQTT